MEVRGVCRPRQRRDRRHGPRLQEIRDARGSDRGRDQGGQRSDNSAFIPSLPAALAKGLLTEQDIDQSLRRVLTVRFRLGEFDPPEMEPYTKIPASVIDSHRDLAFRAARESIALLTNRNNFLPLDRNAIKTIAVIGPYARRRSWGLDTRAERRSSSCRSTASRARWRRDRGDPCRRRRAAGPWRRRRQGWSRGGRGHHRRGSRCSDTSSAGRCAGRAMDPEVGYTEAVAAAKRADVAVVFVGTSGAIEAEGLDRTYLGLPPAQEELVSASSPPIPRR